MSLRRATATATRAGENLYALRLEVENPGGEPIEVDTYEPFLAFSVTGTADGRPVTVHQPALDIPINPITLRIDPGETVTLEPPIRLRIVAGAEAGDDGFIWTIPYDPDAVELQVELTTPLTGACPLSFE